MRTDIHAISAPQPYHTSPSTCLAYDMAGNLYSGGYDGQIIGWRRSAWGRQTGAIVNAVAVFDRILYVVGGDRMASAYSTVTGERLLVISHGHADDLNAVVVTADGSRIAVAGEAGEIWVHEPRRSTTSLVDDPSARRMWGSCINALAILEIDGQGMLAAGNDDGVVGLVRLDGGRTVLVEVSGAVEALCAIPALGAIAVALDTGAVDLISAAGHHLASGQDHSSAVKALALSPSGELLASSSYGGTLVVHDLTVASPTLPLERRLELRVGAGWARGLAWSPVDPAELAVTSLAATPDRWDMATGTCVTDAPVLTPGLNTVTVGSDATVWTGGDAGEIYRVPSSGPPRLLAGEDSLLMSLAVGEGVIYGGFHDGVVRAYDLTGSRIAATSSRGAPINTVALDPTGRLLAAGDYNGGLQILSAPALGTRQQFEQGSAVKSVDFIDSDNVVAGDAGGGLSVWNLATCERIAHRDDLFLVNQVAWNSTTQLLLTVGRDQVIRILTASLEVIAERRAHERSIKAAAWGPDGRSLVTAGYDNTLMLFSFDGAQIIPVDVVGTHEPPGVPAVACLPSGVVVSGGWDGALRFFNSGVESRVERPRRHLSPAVPLLKGAS